jgi:hypothetical protein
MPTLEAIEESPIPVLFSDSPRKSSPAVRPRKSFGPEIYELPEDMKRFPTLRVVKAQ